MPTSTTTAPSFTYSAPTISRRPRATTSTSPRAATSDRKSTRLNSSHANISYAVFCLKKNNKSHLLGHMGDRRSRRIAFLEKRLHTCTPHHRGAGNIKRAHH